jgi:hypothetical protein
MAIEKARFERRFCGRETLTVATKKVTTAASESRCEGEADGDRIRDEGDHKGSGDHGIAINVVNLTSYPLRAKARWNNGAP